MEQVYRMNSWSQSGIREWPMTPYTPYLPEECHIDIELVKKIYSAIPLQYSQSTITAAIKTDDGAMLFTHSGNCLVIERDCFYLVRQNGYNFSRGSISDGNVTAKESEEPIVGRWEDIDTAYARVLTKIGTAVRRFELDSDVKYKDNDMNQPYRHSPTKGNCASGIAVFKPDLFLKPFAYGQDFSMQAPFGRYHKFEVPNSGDKQIISSSSKTISHQVVYDTKHHRAYNIALYTVDAKTFGIIISEWDKERFHGAGGNGKTFAIELNTEKGEINLAATLGITASSDMGAIKHDWFPNQTLQRCMEQEGFGEPLKKALGQMAENGNEEAKSAAVNVLRLLSEFKEIGYRSTIAKESSTQAAVAV